MQPTIEGTLTGAKIMWQGSGDDSIPEQALLIEPSGSTITITQEGRHININYESIPALIRLLRDLKDNR